MKLFNIAKNRPTHGARLERWIGADKANEISLQMRDWYGPPIAVSGVPGNVWALPGGDFGGIIKAGQFLNATEFALMKLNKRIQRFGLKNRQQCNAGFSSLSDLISAATTGGRRDFTFSKTDFLSASSGASVTTWVATGQPAPGVIGSAAPGGRATDSSTTGAMPFTNPSGGDTQHITTAYLSCSVASTALLLYDRLFDVAKTMNSTATEAVTGVPTRYQSTTATDMDYAGGNFVFPEIITSIPATSHNWTVCQYTNQAGTTLQTIPSIAGVPSAVGGQVDLASTVSGQFFMPLATGDTGIKALTQMQCSALLGSGTLNFVIGHPLAWMPAPIISLICISDYINTSFNLARVFDDACLTFINVRKPGGGASVYTGQVTTVSG